MVVSRYNFMVLVFEYFYFYLALHLPDGHLSILPLLLKLKYKAHVQKCRKSILPINLNIK